MYNIKYEKRSNNIILIKRSLEGGPVWRASDFCGILRGPLKDCESRVLTVLHLARTRERRESKIPWCMSGVRMTNAQMGSRVQRFLATDKKKPSPLCPFS